MPRYIDADRLINGIRQAVCATCAIDYNKEKCRCDTGDCICYIEDCPTADVQEVRHGHWINGNCGDYVCSVCGWAFSDELPYMAREYDAETEEIMRYCMHCGAKMDGGENNETDV